MKVFVALFSIVAVVVGNPVPLVQLIVNVEAPAGYNPVAVDGPVNPGPVIEKPVPEVVVPGPVNVVDNVDQPEIVLPAPVVLPPPVLPEVVIPEPVVLPAPVLPEVVVPEVVESIPIGIVTPVEVISPEVIVPVPVVSPSVMDH